MIQDPLITISIPTYNSALFLPKCLEAISKLTYTNFEVNIIDGNSEDNTIQIAKQAGIDKIKICKKALLEARYEGVKIANGSYILLLDSDQILEPEALEKCISLATLGYQAVVLEEDVYSNKTFLEYLFHLDRMLINSNKNLDPISGVMLPRFYEKSLLEEAMEAIPCQVRENVGGQDHAIIYYEVSRLSNKVAIAENAVKHIEPSSLVILVKKFYRWGYTSAHAQKSSYSEFLSKKERFRTGMFRKGYILSSIGSVTLLLLKGFPFFIGRLVGYFRFNK